MMGKKLTEEQIINIVKDNLGVDWEITEVTNSFVDLIDGYGYKYSHVNIHSIRKNKSTRFVNKLNPHTIYNIKLWLKLNNKPFELVSDTYEGNKKNLRWKCLDDNCGEEFESTWNGVSSNNYGCPFCSGHQVSISNCLAILRPDLTLEWHPTKNGKLTPYDFTVSSDKEVWWKCDKGHEWSAIIKNRSKKKSTGCPYCKGSLPSPEYNLLDINPILCEEWDYNKNDKRPEEYTPNSTQHVYWTCRNCGHNWKSEIKGRNNGSGCPECKKSKGEKECKRILLYNGLIEINQENYDKLLDIDKKYNIYLMSQKEFEGLLGMGNGLLSYDFYIPKLNLLIEYQGEQHERYIPGLHKSKKDFEKQVEHDRRKREYAEEHNINLLEIWYYDFDRIEEILSEYIG